MAVARRRGPRLDPTVEPRVIESVLAELATAGRERLSMDRIAAGAGVSKATVYTRWRSKEDLLLAAYLHLSEPFPELATGSVASDVDALCDLVLGAADHRYRAVLTEFVAATVTDASLAPHLREVSGTWQAGIRAMLESAHDRHELPADTDVRLLAETLSALTLVRVMLQNPPVDETLRADLQALVRNPPRLAGGRRPRRRRDRPAP